MSKKVVMYSTPSCKYCNVAKEFFDNNGVEYEVIDLTVNPEKKAEMMELTGQMGVPVIRIGEEDVMVGFKEEKARELLGLGTEVK